MSSIKIQAVTETYTVWIYVLFEHTCTLASVKLFCHEPSWSRERRKEEAEGLHSCQPATFASLQRHCWWCVFPSFWPFTLVISFCVCVCVKKLVSIHNATGFVWWTYREEHFNVLSSWSTVLQKHIGSSKPSLLLTHCFEFNKKDIFLFKAIKSVGEMMKITSWDVEVKMLSVLSGICVNIS